MEQHYNEVLNLFVLGETTMVNYPDDIALVMAAKHLEGAGLYSSETIGAVKTCLESTTLKVLKVWLQQE